MIATLFASALLLPAGLRADDSRFGTFPTYDGTDLELSVDNSGTHFRL